MLTKDTIAKPGFTTLYGTASGAEALALREVLRLAGNRPVIMTCLNDREAARLRQQLAFFAPDVPTLLFPAWDCLPYDRVSPNPSIVAARISTLAELVLRDKHSGPCLVITTVNGLMQRTLPREALSRAVLKITPKMRLPGDKLQTALAELGYQRVSKVMEPGEYALRGDIADLFVPGMERGCRVDLFGDEVESLRAFDPLTQRSEGALDSLVLQPASEVLMNSASIELFRTQYRKEFGPSQGEDELYESVSAGRHYPGMEHWLPLFYHKPQTLFDYVPDAVLVLDAQAESMRTERLETIRDYYAARQAMEKQPSGKGAEAAIYHPLPPGKMYLEEYGWERLEETHAIVELSPFAPEEDGASSHSANLGTRAARNFTSERREGAKIFEALDEYRRESAALHRPLLLAAASPGTRERLRHLLETHNMPSVPMEAFDELAKLSEGTVGIPVFPLERGFEAPAFRCLSEQDILGERIQRGSKKKKAAEYFLAEAANLAEGDLVVHREHGIGKFAGLVTMEVENLKRDCLKILYEGDDKLFIPVENIDIITRYGNPTEDTVALDRLGSASWQSRKAKLKERILLAAEELLKTAAERAVLSAPIYTPQSELYAEFCARFPYSETEDQEKAIEDVLGDLASGRVMDRLVCGDVGFGKTEVALRAAIAVAGASEKPAQVAVIAPTTLLARQHFAGFTKRFAGMPITVRQLSRMVSAKDAKDTQEGLREGKVDVVVGTHALLGKGVEFSNLGLLIVDEEQHFGVAQKEKLKSLREGVHVLTLSATPIPRTLQMALTGVRELSLITTPPVDRLAVRTFVLPFDPLVLREAILRERHRGGQIFYVTPRIGDLAELEHRIRELVPDIKLAVAHGQMPPTALDTVMTEFYEGKYDMLLSTSIVESGLDVPTANTLIVHRADRFGLSQLYQLRGRVGRGKIRAYAYFTLQHQKNVTATALRRLEVMQSLDTLGAGFSVASHDMDIRGFGNLLGEEQSGHVKEVGIELYQQMLEEAVDAARRRAKRDPKADALDLPPMPQEQWTPQINLGLSVLIPESYLPDLELRMGLYRRAGTLATVEEVDAFAVEMIDRFGPLPEEVEHLLTVLKTKILCRLAGIEKLDAGPKGITFTFRPEAAPAPEKLLGFVARHAGKAKLRPDNKMVLLEEWRTEAQRLKGVEKAILDLVALTEEKQAA